MRDYPQHTIITREETSKDIIDSIILHRGDMPYLHANVLKLKLELLVAVAQKEQMIEDHKVYMGAVKEANA